MHVILAVSSEYSLVSTLNFVNWNIYAVGSKLPFTISVIIRKQVIPS